MGGLSILSFLFTFLFTSFTWGHCPEDKIIPGQYLVRIRAEKDFASLYLKNGKDTEETLAESVDSFHVIFRGQTGRSFSPFSKTAQPLKARPKLVLVEDPHFDVEHWRRQPGILSIEPNCQVEPLIGVSVPNDPLYPSQWHLRVIEALAAWQGHFHSNVVVAISDTGVDYEHPDLKDQMWTNAAEENGKPGVDDDNNGCIDDIYGCDFADMDGDPRPGHSNMARHGTHVAGIVAATRNNSIGVVGVASAVRLMAVKGFFDAQDGTNIASLLATVYYAIENGARIVNCSWGTVATPTAAEKDAFDYARENNVLVVAAAGNKSMDAEKFSPAALPNIITVGATNSFDELSAFSNYGHIIDLVAPGGDSSALGGRGEKIYSTLPTSLGSYGGEIGTSMAAPVVTGVAALVWSINPDLTVDEVEDILKKSATPIEVTVIGKPHLKFSYRRVNARAAVELAEATSPVRELEGNDVVIPPPLTNDFSEAINSGMGGCGSATGSPAGIPDLFILSLIFILPVALCQTLKRRSLK